MKPNFLFIGTAKAGSTWLYNVLNQHPGCFVPVIKDIYYFDKFYERGEKWYIKHFNKADSNTKVIGELSHDYLFSKEAADRIKSDLVDVKLVVILRNPIERTFSDYLHHIRNGLVSNEINLEEFKKSIIKYPDLIKYSQYAEFIKYYLSVFERDKIQILFFDDLKISPDKFILKILKFLNLEYISSIDYKKVILPASKPVNSTVSFLVHYGTKVARFFKMETLIGKLKYSKLYNLLYSPYDKSKKPVINMEIKDYLYDIFKDDINELERAIDEDLSSWKL